MIGSSAAEGVSLRVARPEDFQRLLEIDRECFPPGIAYSARELRDGMRGWHAFTLIAENHVPTQRIAGFLVARLESGTRGHIITIDVLPQFRRKGIGRLLMRDAESRLVSAGASSLQLEAAVNNFAALAFYHRLGFHVVRILRGYYNGELDGLLLEKPCARVAAQN
jgi:ribosomal-protein-alanine N-acetyltransferase